MLVLEESRYDFQNSLSDIAGWDIEAHNGDHQTSVRRVTRWLVNHAGAKPRGTQAILDQYADLQAQYWEREIAREPT